MASALPQVSVAQEAMAPTYARMRSGAGDWHARGGYGRQGFGIGFVQPFYQPPIVTGSYYQRPYPYHFDYYRSRWGAASEQAPTLDCRCATQDSVSVAPSP